MRECRDRFQRVFEESAARDAAGIMDRNKVLEWLTGIFGGDLLWEINFLRSSAAG